MAKFLKNSSGSIVEEATVATSAGAGSSGKVPNLDSNGKLDTTFMPSGIGADTVAVTASEALAAGDFVNIYDSGSGVFSCRKADATNPAKEAHGYVLASVSSSASATIYFDDTNTGVTSQTPGPSFLSATTPGKSTATAPSTSGYIVQRVGVATSATTVHVAIGVAITLA